MESDYIDESDDAFNSKKKGKEKMRKVKTQFEIEKSIRRVWAFSPATRIVESKKHYNRKRSKAEMRREEF